VGTVLFLTEAGKGDQSDAGEDEECAAPDDEHEVGAGGQGLERKLEVGSLDREAAGEALGLQDKGGHEEDAGGQPGALESGAGPEQRVVGATGLSVLGADCAAAT